MSPTGAARFSVEPFLLARLSQLVGERLGLVFPEERWDDLERGAHAAARELGFPDTRSLILWMDSHSPERKTTEILASHLTVGETYFFRDAKLFRTLEHILLPSLISAREPHRRLRIWCAACSTGEEAYSLAILVRKLLRDYRTWAITILASDINVRSLRKAEEGLYADWSFRDTPAWVRAGFFTKHDGRWRIDPSLAQMVTFQFLNLLDETYPSLVTNTNAMDLILCRNVLMYFGPNQARRVVERLSRCLVHDGWLIVSPAEMSQTLFPEFEVASVSEVLLYRKRRDEGREVAAFGAGATLFDPGQKHPSEMAPAQQEMQEFPAAVVVNPQEPTNTVEGGNLSEAKKFRNDSNDAQHLVRQVRLHAGAGHLAEAEEACRRAVTLEKLNPSLHYLHATILHELGRDDEAHAALRKALYLDPEHLIAHFTMGMLFARAQKRKDMQRHLRTALALTTRLQPDEPLPEADGMTAGSLAHIIRSVLEES